MLYRLPLLVVKYFAVHYYCLLMFLPINLIKEIVFETFCTTKNRKYRDNRLIGH